MRVNLFRRGRVFWGQWTLSAGACVVCGLTHRVHRHTTETTDRVAARAVAAGWERLAADPSYRAAHTTIADASTRWLATYEDAPDGTKDMVECKAAHVVRVLGPAFVVARVDAIAVDAFVATRRAEGVSSNTIYKELCALRGILRLAQRRGEYERDPRGVMPLRFRAKYVPRTRFLTRAELQLLCTDLPPCRAACVRFMVATGARLTEFRRARREDVRTGVVVLRSSKGRGGESRPREVPIVAPWQRELLEHAIEEASGVDGALFEPWPWLHRELRAACARLGIAPVSPNDLRRTYASFLAQGGAREEHIARSMGHASSEMVRRVYAQLPTRDLGRLLSPAGKGLAMVAEVVCPACRGCRTAGSLAAATFGPCERCAGKGVVPVLDVRGGAPGEGQVNVADDHMNDAAEHGASALRSSGPSRSRTGSQRIKSPIASGVEDAAPAGGVQGAGTLEDAVIAAMRREWPATWHVGRLDTAFLRRAARQAIATVEAIGVAEALRAGATEIGELRKLVAELEASQRQPEDERSSFPEPAGVLDAIAATARIGKLGERTGDREVVIGTLRGMAERLGMTFPAGAVRHATKYGDADGYDGTTEAGTVDIAKSGCVSCACEEKDAGEGGSR
jgi:integrase